MSRTVDAGSGSRRWVRGVAGVLLGVLPLQACYSVGAIEPGGPQPGTRVVASLTPEGSQQLASQVGPRVVAVEGVLDEATADQLSLRMVRTEGANRVTTWWNQEEVSIPRPAIAQLSERRLDRTRSYLTGVVVVGVALLAAALTSSVFAGDDSGEPPPGTGN